MRARTNAIAITLSAAVSLVAMTNGCAATGRASARTADGASRSADPAPRSATPARDSRPDSRPASRPAARPAAIVGGQPVTWDQLQPGLAEAAGALALQEMALDRALRNRVRAQGVTITDADRAAERAALADALAAQGSSRALDSVRARRGLGPVRYAALIERNAMLRALVRDRATVTEDEVDLAMLVRFGEKLDCRLVVYANVTDAAAGRSRLGDAATPEAFAFEALEHSIDASRVRGGRIEPFHAADPSVPEAIRLAADALRPGSVSPVVVLPTGAAVVRLDSRLPARAGASRATVREDLLRRKQGRAMDELARSIVQRIEITPLDRSLGWSVENSPITAAPER